ncbi:hypothetical protein QBC39DRAFT_137902 [Podospora conica]|nr:hypothetical protein QBC39DRAFT_137902 [Schizothecium conicum]
MSRAGGNCHCHWRPEDDADHWGLAGWRTTRSVHRATDCEGMGRLGRWTTRATGPLSSRRWGFPCNRQRARVMGREKQLSLAPAQIGSEILTHVLQGHSLPPQHQSTSPRSPPSHTPTRHPLSLVASWCAHIISPQPVGALGSLAWILFSLVELLTPLLLPLLAQSTSSLSPACKTSQRRLPALYEHPRSYVAMPGPEPLHCGYSDNTARNCRKPQNTDCRTS